MSGTRVDWTQLRVESHTDFDQQEDMHRDGTPYVEPEHDPEWEYDCPECGGELEMLRFAPVARCVMCGFTEPL